LHTHDSALYSCGKARALLSPPCMMNQAITYRGIGLPRLDVSAGSESSAQRMDAVTEDEEYRHFYLQYFFPPSSVGEVRYMCSCFGGQLDSCEARCESQPAAAKGRSKVFLWPCRSCCRPHPSLARQPGLRLPLRSQMLTYAVSTFSTAACRILLHRQIVIIRVHTCGIVQSLGLPYQAVATVLHILGVLC